MRLIPTALALLIATSLPAMAAEDIDADASSALQIRFVESAPKDRFEIVNGGSCGTGTFDLAFDLTETAGKLIFDTTGSGAGVEVFQPFEIVSGPIQLAAARVMDGDRTLKLRIDGLEPGERAAFTIDVDDTLRDSALGQIRVADSEMTGGRVELTSSAGWAGEGRFDANSKAEILLADCVS